MSDSEFSLLLTFLEHPRTVLSRADLLELLHGDECEQFDRAVDTLISRLRRKLDLPGSEEYIRTVRGEGYIFEPSQL
ncbi:winged helix-turn-helix domain-containing protein [Croceicoccus hydrothermalis]|uniref:winged helix-turn-helix domain-containing protein n=1 Tax=Croceicoccus hydrothermalis TaxID=2867964 RepID=UPI001EFA7595|nr:winged helix-turn-helix domain-containing protein [Croceicoccus hydrothermalis]